MHNPFISDESYDGSRRTAAAVKAAHRNLRRVLVENDRAVRRICESLLGRVAAGETLPDAAVWLLDNFSFIHGQAGEVKEALSRGYYRDLMRAGKGAESDVPRIYSILRDDFVPSTPRIDAETIRSFFTVYQWRVLLSLAEAWAIRPLLKLVLLERLYRAAIEGDLDTETAENGIRSAVIALRGLENIPWRDLIESISPVDEALRRDPAGAYSSMEFESRDLYRRAVEQIARHSRENELRIAQAAVECASEAPDGRESHVGYYLIGAGIGELRRRTRTHPGFADRMRETARHAPNFFYLGGIALLTVALIYAIRAIFAPVPWWCCLLVAIPASQAAVSAINLLVSRLLPPQRLPRMDFSQGVPEQFRTFVVIPTLLLSTAGIERLLERLEIHYLANRDSNLLFALLTDFADAPEATTPNDHLLDLCEAGIRKLNDRHANVGRRPFYLFHRARVWNKSERVWMGRERKRGKLEDFNAFLLGDKDGFERKAGDLAQLGSVRFVITLDSDTQLPRDTAWKLIGTLAHPLNQPILDPTTGIVREGYGLLQPRVSISMESAGRSRLAKIYSGETGLDPYTRAVSDAYQDLYGRGSYTGKGIYDLRAFHHALEGRFPDNTLLSHDLIEGEHARVGLVSDVDVIDDYPQAYEAWSKRKHRWVRGDWQIFLWLLPRTPNQFWKWSSNPLPLLSRWKILDNLRRSLFEISLTAWLLAGWLFVPEASMRFAIVAVAIVLLPAYFETALALMFLPPVRFWRGYFRDRLLQLTRSHVEALLSLTFLLHQAFLMSDAIVRTIVRRVFTRRRLLEWESMAQAEAVPGTHLSLIGIYLVVCPAAAVACAMLARSFQEASWISLSIAGLWILSPLAAEFVSTCARSRQRPEKSETEFLHEVSLLTWRYFMDFSRPEDHWLVPDNVQEDPPAIARRTSPTNFGLQLTANFAAFDFGYLTADEVSLRLDSLLGTIVSLERHRGHFYNWYDTRTLEPLRPRYISTVDSGNLAAALITLKEACTERMAQPAIGPVILDGLWDHCLRLRGALPSHARSSSLMRLFTGLERQLEYRPSDLFFWEGVLTEVSSMIDRLSQHVDWACGHLAARDSGEVDEIRYWQRALNNRIEAVRGYLGRLAPWLCPPFEDELRACSHDSNLRRLMAQLTALCPLGKLASQYDEIEKTIGGLLNSPVLVRDRVREMLLRLLDELPAARAAASELVDRFKRQSETCSRLALEMDFAFLFDHDRELFRIGYDADGERLDGSYYDLLASEARTAVFLAIAKGDAPREAWFRLGRKITSFRGHRTLMSWSGTMFEYLMPSLFMKTYERTLLGESLAEVVRIQKRYAHERYVPWGISESAHSARDGSLNYQYQAFGIPSISLKGSASDDLVIAPYASVLALMTDRPAAAGNLKLMAGRGWLGRYGFYEAIDFRKRRLPGATRSMVVRTFMAHHQAMSLLSLCNVLLGQKMPERFHSNPMVLATELLLQERLPALAAPEKEELNVPQSQPQVAMRGARGDVHPSGEQHSTEEHVALSAEAT